MEISRIYKPECEICLSCATKKLLDIHFMENLVTETLKQRIRERMELLGKNPSSVALDANLSRSAVRDILSGKAKNPGIVTIYAIAQALECSESYLMGESDSLHYAESTDILIDVNARTSEISGTLEAGLFKQAPLDERGGIEDPFTEVVSFGRRERKPFRSTRRYLYRDLFLYRMGDSSLDELGIKRSDLIVAVYDPDSLHLKSGMLVIVSHRLAGNVEELSGRIVRQNGSSFSLLTASSGTAYAPIEITQKADEPATFHTVVGGKVFIEGVAVELTRQLDL